MRKRLKRGRDLPRIGIQTANVIANATRREKEIGKGQGSGREIGIEKETANGITKGTGCRDAVAESLTTTLGLILPWKRGTPPAPYLREPLDHTRVEIGRWLNDWDSEHEERKYKKKVSFVLLFLIFAVSHLEGRFSQLTPTPCSTFWYEFFTTISCSDS
jgi:hypothetical protein